MEQSENIGLRPRQIGVKKILVEGREVEVRVFESAVETQARVDRGELSLSEAMQAAPEFSLPKIVIEKARRESGCARSNHWLSEEKVAALEKCYRAGLSTRVSQSRTGIQKKTIAKYFNRFRREIGPILCGCGQDVRHQGWCSVRFKESPARQKVVQKFHQKGYRVFDRAEVRKRLAKKRSNIRSWCKMAEEFDDRGSGTFQTSVFICAAIDVGQNPESISEATGINVEYIRPRVQRLIDNRIWKDGKWCVDFDPKDKGNNNHALVEFALFSLCAEGTVVRVPE